MSAGFTPAVRELVMQRSGLRCERCGGYANHSHYHHRRPRAMGSTRRADTTSAANCLWLCTAWDRLPSGGCHEFVESHRETALNLGWLVRQHHDPADTPVYYRGTWVFIDDHGQLLAATDGGIQY